MCRVEGPQLLKDASQSGQAKEGNSRLQGPEEEEEEEDEGVNSDYDDVPEAPVCCPDQVSHQLLVCTCAMHMQKPKHMLLCILTRLDVCILPRFLRWVSKVYTC
jgi:hypothetical protein